MLFVHEVHKVVGRSAADFEQHYREGWLPALAQGNDARLAWYFDLAHGSGLSYRVVTVTAVADGAAWGRLAERLASGDLQAWARDLDSLQHASEARILAPLPWSPAIGALGTLADIPDRAADHEPGLYMEDTMWPFPGQLDAYIEAAGSVYTKTLAAAGSRMKMGIALALRTTPGAGRHPEIVLLQRLSSLDRLIGLLTSDPPSEVVGEGTWMHEALELRDQWRSRLLRSAPWSPLP